MPFKRIFVYSIILLVFLFFKSSNCQIQLHGVEKKGFDREDWHYRDEESSSSNATLTMSPNEVDIIEGDSFELYLYLRGHFEGCVELRLTTSPDQITTLPVDYEICSNETQDVESWTLKLNSTNNGIVILQVVASPADQIDTSEAFCSVSIGMSHGLNVVSSIFGWIYTIAWDISFLPQIIHNWKRKSVIGLSFDFLTLNLIGFTGYFFYNAGFYWLPGIQDRYYVKNPTSVLHVRLNDVIFPTYALICTVMQITQCFIYERGGQRVSTTCRIISAILICSAVVYSILVPLLDNLWWINFLYFLSYEKLTVSFIKYAPQIFLNYKKKSTRGYNIWGVILDFTGGSFSLLQMFLLAANYDDWHSVLTDPAKLGLGIFSIAYNIIFFIQHYCLYRNARDVESEVKETIEDK